MAIPKQVFGRTGHLSTRTLFGAAAFADVTQDEADRSMQLLLDYGVNHIDTAASYGDSELRLGPWLERYRDQFFLATKTDERTYDGAKAQFERSLRRLRVDEVDLIQLHYLVGEEEWQVAMGAGGALEYLIEAREQGLVKYIGVTGHDVAIARMHQRSLERFDFDSVLLPYNYLMMQNPVYRSGFNEVLEMCAVRNVAVQTIKGITRRPYLSGERSHATWYEPLTDQPSIDKAVHWALGNEQVFLNTAGDIDILPKVLSAASRFAGRTPEVDMQAMVAEWEMVPLFV
ncbi:MAG: aldo/keto reductase [Chloroflexi bacterium]|nr:aldo/keto reductase [Chloroflexota bacterium]MCY3581913.1 aldo/keto reductase [Chloroflexota bacterium]MXX50721.1 aldo/keto reductase [Chloroflexota bacterium]MXX84677.1 aldo/keto reductase [Chloroflexota bacterium]MYA92707.1 aldo/keto reductase [Chloroflexota bacterium]